MSTLSRRACWLGLLGVCAAWTSWGIGFAAPDEPAATAPGLVELNRVTATLKNGKWMIAVNGRAPLVPVGAQFQVQVRYSYQVLEVFTFTLDSTKRFDLEFESHQLSGVMDRLYVSFLIPVEAQGPAVLEAIEKAPDKFPANGSPWATAFTDKPFQLGTDEELSARVDTINEFFKKNMIALRQVAIDLENGRASALDKTSYHKDGAFDAEAWRKFIEEDVRDRLRQLQAQIIETTKATTYLDCPRDVTLLKELAAGVAARTYERSRSLYEELGLSVDPADMSPRDLDINTKKQATGKYLNGLLERLAEARKIAL